MYGWGYVVQLWSNHYLNSNSDHRGSYTKTRDTRSQAPSCILDWQGIGQSLCAPFPCCFLMPLAFQINNVSLLECVIYHRLSETKQLNSFSSSPCFAILLILMLIPEYLAFCTIIVFLWIIVTPMSVSVVTPMSVSVTGHGSHVRVRHSPWPILILVSMSDNALLVSRFFSYFMSLIPGDFCFFASLDSRYLSQLLCSCQILW